MSKNTNITRRDALKTAAISGLSIFGGLHPLKDLLVHSDELTSLSQELVNTWGTALLKLQVTDPKDERRYGGILSPATEDVHGRVGDAIYPFLFLAKKTGDHRYLDGALLLFDWIEKHVSQPDGSWLNEPKKGSWKGTTVFAATALGEALKYHADVMPAEFRSRLSARLKLAGEYIYRNFNVKYGNINYPVNGAYALSLLGQVLHEPRFNGRGRELAGEVSHFFTKNDHLIFGEGDLDNIMSKKGCLCVDLGYNVEESLPALALYCKLTGDHEMQELVMRSLHKHLQFMLPDGGWDNSWGTRNYKWTYWGSRTTDGCQPAYVLMSEKEPAFYKAALQNTKLLASLTVNGLLQGGPHCHLQGIPVSVHHTFCHIKALTTILDHGIPKQNSVQATLPMEKITGITSFTDVQTWLVSHGKFRATVTGYDKDYKHFLNGHASGGALTMLWHQKAGIILCASMNEYQLIEADNMQTTDSIENLCLTPRLELHIAGKLYTNISDQQAVITTQTASVATIITVKTRLVDPEQRDPDAGPAECSIRYEFSDQGVSCIYNMEKAHQIGDTQLVFPVIAGSNEPIIFTGQREITVKKRGANVNFSASAQFVDPLHTERRVFNFVPGLQAYPLTLKGPEIVVRVGVS